MSAVCRLDFAIRMMLLNGTRKHKYKISCVEEKHLFQSHCALTMFSINKVFDIQRLECDSVSYKEMCKSYDYLQ